MINSILAITQNSLGADISPELAEASPWLNDVVTVGNGMMNSGIDPGLALATIAAVPIVLKVLNMINQFTAAAVEDWRETNKIARERERLALETEKLAAEALAALPPERRPVAYVRPVATSTHPLGRVPGAG